MTEEQALYKTLVETTLAIPWKIDWQTQRFVYIGAQLEHMLGWSSNEWQTVDDWVQHIHPQDRDCIVDFRLSQIVAGRDHEATYRICMATGEYIWIRDVAHVIRDAKDQPEALLGFTFKVIHPQPSCPLKATDMLTEKYDLTPTEQKITHYLSQGLSQKDIAFKLDIKHDTIRKNLQSIYKKTNTINQSELIKLLFTTPRASVYELNQ